MNNPEEIILWDGYARPPVCPQYIKIINELNLYQFYRAKEYFYENYSLKLFKYRLDEPLDKETVILETEEDRINFSRFLLEWANV